MNPFEALDEIYNEQLKEADLKGHAKLYKQCTEKFLSEVVKLKDDVVLTVEDLKYLDGYYIFASGTNSVVHFHIKECPGWLFGIWWEPEYESNESNDIAETLNFKFFAQHEETIDKFKPSASTWCVESKLENALSKSVIDYVGLIHCQNMLNFIYSEPALAFCRHEFGYDYNTEYVSKERAEKEFKEFFEEKHRHEAITARLDNQLLDYYRQHIVPLFVGGAIVDKGESWYPRYDLHVPLSTFEIPVEGPGAYSLEIYSKYSLDAAKAIKGLESLERMLKNAAEQESVAWYHPIDEVFFLYDDTED